MGSRRNPSRSGAKRPFGTRVTFNGATGLFEYYDSSKKIKVELDKLEITPLVTKSIISGFHKGVSQQIMSNYVEDLSKEQFVGFYFNNKKFTKLDGFEGFWSDIKDRVKEAGGRFSTSIIGLATLTDHEETIELVVSNFTLGQWIEYNDENPDALSSSLVINKGKLYKKGTKKDDKIVEVTDEEAAEIAAKLKKNPRASVPVTFFGIDIEGTPLSDKDLEYTDTKIEEIEDYFDGLSSRSNNKPAKAGPTNKEESSDDEDDDDLPF